MEYKLWMNVNQRAICQNKIFYLFIYSFIYSEGKVSLVLYLIPTWTVIHVMKVTVDLCIV